MIRGSTNHQASNPKSHATNIGLGHVAQTEPPARQSVSLHQHTNRRTKKLRGIRLTRKRQRRAIFSDHSPGPSLPSHQQRQKLHSAILVTRSHTGHRPPHGSHFCPRYYTAMPGIAVLPTIPARPQDPHGRADRTIATLMDSGLLR